MATKQFDYTAIPGTPESQLTPEMLQQLPKEAAPAPWDARGEAILWWSRPHPALSSHLTPAIRDLGQPMMSFGAILHYDQTPVGAYGEVMAVTTLRSKRHLMSHCPFIAVDSPASTVGGRVNWALAKTLARFDGSPARRAMSAHGPSWTIRVTAKTYGPALSLRLPSFSLVQQTPDGLLRARLKGRARLRLARVSVEVSGGEALLAFMPMGRLWGVVGEPMNGWLSASESYERNP